jgi:hypothetical protein
LVSAVYFVPRSTELAVTVAPAIAAPLVSVTVPVIVAVTSCAKVAFESQSRKTKVAQHNANATYLNFLITVLPLRDPSTYRFSKVAGWREKRIGDRHQTNHSISATVGRK